MLLSTLTHIHASVIPVLASDGTVFMDSRAHKTIWDGCVAARAHGTTVVPTPTTTPRPWGRLLHRHSKAPRLVCVDGVNSMTGNPPRLPEFLALARANDALVYVDDAHGFGAIGEHSRSDTRARPRWHHWPACSPGSRSTRPGGRPAGHLLGQDPADPRHLEKLGAFTLNRSGFPIVEVPLGDADDFAKASRFLLEQGSYVTLAFYPGVPREEVGFRIQVTAANTDDEVSELLVALDRLADVVPLRPI